MNGKVNSPAFCSQEVPATTEEIKEAGAGSERESPEPDNGLSVDVVSGYLTKNAALFRVAKLEGIAEQVARESADSLLAMADDLKTSGAKRLRLEDVERRPTVLEGKPQAALLASAPDEELLSSPTVA